LQVNSFHSYIRKNSYSLIFHYFRRMKFAFHLVVFIFMAVISTSAQLQTPVTGKWKVVAVNNGVYYDYKKQKATITPDLMQTLKGRADSAQAVEAFTKMAKKYSDYFIIFGKDGLYWEVMNGEVRGDTAVYWLLEEEHLVYMRRATDEEQTIQNMSYDIQKDGTMELTITFMDRKMRMTLEKSE
jgi:hypothetical protein